MKNFLNTFIIFIVVILNLSAQSSNYQFISPKPNSDFNTIESTVIIREGNLIDPSTLNENALRVEGSQSGTISGKIILSSDSKTIIFEPDKNFKASEIITVTIDNRIKRKDGINLDEYSFSFKVAPFTKTPNPYDYIEELNPNFYSKKRATSKVNSTSNNFPTLKVNTYDQDALGDGYIFLAVASEVENVGYYLMMLNNDGTPYWSKELKDDYAYDFKLQPNGQVTYAQFIEHHSYTGGGNVIHKILDHETLEEIDEVQMGNGYIAEAHDFQILPNGHFLLFGYYLTKVDLSNLVEGGYPNALVSGGVVQELDKDKNVVFQWRTWDHYDFENHEWGPRANRPIVSEFHLNTINLDADNNIIIATPRWVKKINRQTGERVWSLGDFDNDFTFINCDEDYVGGHMFHRLNGNNFLIYDNGNRQGTKTSRVHELILDEQNMTCELFWSYVPDTTIAGWHRGNAHRLSNGNTVIGWGGSSGRYSPTFSEVSPTGEKLLEVFFDPYDVQSYRAFRFPFTGGAPIAEVVESEVANGTTYNFIDEQTGNTGISVKINTREGQGYNELIVTKYNYAPLKPIFANKPPQVLPRRFVLSNYGITGINAEVLFDVEIWNIKDPENAIVYQREFEDNGLFVPLTTTYNPVTNTLKATIDRFGEFIITNDDLKSLNFEPKLLYPGNNGKVNQELPLTLEWTPVGYVTNYSLQVSQDSGFINLIVDSSNLTEARFTINELDAESNYYWRVKSKNDAGESDWSSFSNFSTEQPFIKISYPSNETHLQIGLKYFIKWDDNINENVIINLFKEDTFLASIDTVESDRAYQWEVDPSLKIDSDYQIQIISQEQSNLFSLSNNFSLIDTVTSVEYDGLPRNYKLDQNYPNPFNPATTIKFQLPEAGVVKLSIYNLLGEKITELINGKLEPGYHTVDFVGNNLSSGIYFYQITVDNYTDTRKMILMK